MDMTLNIHKNMQGEWMGISAYHRRSRSQCILPQGKFPGKLQYFDDDDKEITSMRTNNMKLFVKDFPRLCLQMQRPSECVKP
jgi:hypothetical protein